MKPSVRGKSPRGNIRKTLWEGRARTFCCDRTSRTDRILRVKGIRMIKRLPFPSWVSKRIVPRRLSTRCVTMSSPKPRPDNSLTLVAVEKPGEKIQSSSFSRLFSTVSFSEIKPRAIARWRILARLTPRPSSVMVSITWLLAIEAARVIVPSLFLPKACRSFGNSKPWSNALRIKWVRGVRNCSRMTNSTRIVSPTISKRTDFWWRWLSFSRGWIKDFAKAPKGTRRDWVKSPSKLSRDWRTWIRVSWRSRSTRSISSWISCTCTINSWKRCKMVWTLV